MQQVRKFEKSFVRFPIVNKERKLLADVSINDVLSYLHACYNLDYMNYSSPARAFILKAIEDPLAIEGPSEEIKQEIQKFWGNRVDFKSPVLHISKSPTFVPLNTSLAKIHFLFLLLGLSQIYITDQGRLEGIINRETFWSAKK